MSKFVEFDLEIGEISLRPLDADGVRCLFGVVSILIEELVQILLGWRWGAIT